MIYPERCCAHAVDIDVWSFGRRRTELLKVPVVLIDLGCGDCERYYWQSLNMMLVEDGVRLDVFCDN